jgi:hypothetical protein
MGDKNGCEGGLENMVVQGTDAWTNERGDEMVGVNGPIDGQVNGKVNGCATRLVLSISKQTVLEDSVKLLCSRKTILCSLYRIQWLPVGALLCPMVAHYFA